MKLLRIKINSEFGSLQEGFELHFRDPFKEGRDKNENWQEFHPFCFAGLNGSGKSNVLEAISGIFYHLESCANVNQPENFKERFRSQEGKPDAYELAYYIKPKTEKGEHHIENMVLITVTKKKEESPEMKWQPYPFDGEKMRDIEILSKDQATIPASGKDYLPDLIVAYSSGENEILSIPFLKTRLVHFDEYKEAIAGNIDYEKPESNMVYIDYEMSQAVLLSNYMFQNKETVLKPLDKYLDIVDIKRFRMNLNIGHQLEKQPILKQFNKTLQKFKNCGTVRFDNGKKLLLDFWVNDDTKEAFRRNFKGGIYELFQAFQVLYTLNYRKADYGAKSEVYGSQGYYTHGKINMPGPLDKTFYFLDYYIQKRMKGTGEIKELLLKQLSDGEQQFLHSLGICLMLRNKNALLLLDEPETHFNPDWRSKFISTLKKSLEATGSNDMTRDILITSHSPFIISDCLPDKVIYFRRKKENPKEVEGISARELNFKSFGASVDIILEVLFGKRQSIGNLARTKLQYDLNKVKTKADVDAIKEQISDMGESIEKDLLLASLNQLNLQ